jgi:ubiquinone/menaquinone biosynthesis C-methylase UbiE
LTREAVKPLFFSQDRHLHFVKAFLRFFFKLLYHQFAFTYDLVAGAVSFNRWKDWVECVIPFIEGTRLLELGHGPGHLQRLLLSRELIAVAIDESSQMGRIASRNTNKSARLTRGVAQNLPFANGSFETIVSTFPTEYIFDPRTLAEVRRCLSEGGRLVVLPVALPKNPFLDWLYRITGETPSEVVEVVESRLVKPFQAAGFEVDVITKELQSSTLLIVIAGT